MGAIHLLKQPPSVDGGYLHNNGAAEYNVPCNEASHINIQVIFTREKNLQRFLALEKHSTI